MIKRVNLVQCNGACQSTAADHQMKYLDLRLTKGERVAFCPDCAYLKRRHGIRLFTLEQVERYEDREDRREAEKAKRQAHERRRQQRRQRQHQEIKPRYQGQGFRVMVSGLLFNQVVRELIGPRLEMTSSPDAEQYDGPRRSYAPSIHGPRNGGLLVPTEMKVVRA